MRFQYNKKGTWRVLRTYSVVISEGQFDFRHFRRVWDEIKTWVKMKFAPTFIYSEFYRMFIAAHLMACEIIFGFLATEETAWNLYPALESVIEPVSRNRLTGYQTKG